MSRWRSAAVAEALRGEARFLPVTVTGVDVVGEEIVVAFTSPDRPGCDFVFRWPSAPNPEEGLDQETPETWASLARINLTEIIEAQGYGLPSDCAPGETFEVSFESCSTRRR